MHRRRRVPATVPPMAERRRIDECLSVRDGRLLIERCDACELAERFGTPLYVVSEDQLRRNARRLVQAFSACWDGPVNVLPSIKANHVLALRRILSEEGLGCDTFGHGELWAALACEVPPSLISVNGSGKSAQLIEDAVAAGCRITLDAPRELDLAIAAARRIGRRARLRVRVRPDLSALQGVPSDFSAEGESIPEVSRRYKAGIPWNELLPLGARALAAEEVELVGVHAHFARHTRSPRTWEAMARSFGAAVRRLCAAWEGWLPRELDIGGGLPGGRDPTGRSIPRVAADQEPPPPVSRYAEAICGGLRASLTGSGITPADTTLEIEPGRACYADIGVHLSRVVNVKTESEPEPLRFVELDTTEMFLLDIHLEHDRFTQLVANRASEPASGVADLVGCSCGFDTITADAALPDLVPGDVVAFLDTGAYQEASATNFNALPRPATVLVSGDGARVVRRAETIEDVFARDLDAAVGADAHPGGATGHAGAADAAPTQGAETAPG
jgi:diaminopimelate decarboxylase